MLDLFGVWANNFRALSKIFGLSSEKSAGSGDGYIIFVYGTFLEETFCMEETNNCLGFRADIMFTPIKSFSTGMSKLHFMFSGNWLHLKNSSKSFNVSFKLRAKKLLILVKKNTVNESPFPCREEQFAPNKFWNKRLWALIFIRPFINNFSDVWIRNFGNLWKLLFALRRNVFVMKSFHSFLQNKIFAKVDWKISNFVPEKN